MTGGKPSRALLRRHNFQVLDKLCRHHSISYFLRRLGLAARGLDRALDVMIASASISTSITGETIPPTWTIAVAGRILPKNSPCARPTFSHSAMLATNMRVRTTSFFFFKQKTAYEITV